MKVVIHILVSLIHVAFTLNTPTFTLLDSRSDAPIPIPNIFVTFPDGYSDNLVLNRFYSENEADGCHFLGHLENEQEACVAMTGCIGSEDIEFTIMSEHAPETNLFKWKIDGNVEVVDHPFKNGADNVITRADDAPGDPSQMKAESQIEKSLTAKSKTPPPNQKLKVKVFYDESLKTRLGSLKALKAFYDSAHVHLQAVFCHVSLGSKIKLERVGDLSLYERKEGRQLLATDQGMKDVTDFTLKNIGNANLVIYITDNDKKDSNGIAPIASLCIPSKNFKSYDLKKVGWVGKKANAWKFSINEYKSSVAAFGTLIAHEMGHNFGMEHDHDKVHGGEGSACDKRSNVMSYESARTKWSTCSKKDFQIHYDFVIEENPWCLEVLSSDACAGVTIPKTTTAKPTSPPLSKCKGDTTYVGDGTCDDNLNNAACNYDGGDCCGKNVKKFVCTVCKCLDPKFKGK